MPMIHPLIAAKQGTTIDHINVAAGSR